MSRWRSLLWRAALALALGAALAAAASSFTGARGPACPAPVAGEAAAC